MVPKIADFGLSKIFCDELTRTTQSLLGTTGYRPPEYIERGEFSEKFDIFSLGAVIITIVSGPNDGSKYQDIPPDEFIDQVQRNWRKKWQETCSSNFLLEASCHQVKARTQIALDCLETDSQKRPDIVKIIDKLIEIETEINETYGAYGEHDTVFMMHDLVHDLAVSLLGDKILDHSKQGSNTGGSSCRYALLTDCSKPLDSWMASPARLSALHFLDCWRTELHGAAFESAETLRVLDLSKCSIQNLPDSIGRLKQLTFLNAPRIRDQMVPESITKLSNLRYLNLNGSCSILALPESIGELGGFAHVDLSGCMALKNLPESFGNLKSLEHLDFRNCQNVTGVSQCLVRLTKLRYLNLLNCNTIGDLPREFGRLTELQYLNLSGSSYLSGNKFAEAEFLGSLTKLNYLNLCSGYEPWINVSIMNRASSGCLKLWVASLDSSI